MSIQWKPYLWDGPRQLDASQVDELERGWKVKLPAQYRETVQYHQGMTPEPGVFNVGRGRSVFLVLLSISVREGYEAYSIGFIHELLKQHMPQGIFPFGETPGGEHLCFDYKNSSEEPRIVLVTEEMSIYPVADCFQHFLEGLYDGNERPR